MLNSSRHRRVRGARTLACIALLLLISACGAGKQPVTAPPDDGGDAPIELSQSDWDAVVAAAKEEGEVVVYTSAGGTQEAFQEFTKTYPDIKVTAELQATSDLVTRLDQEIGVGATTADVAVHAQVVWYEERGRERSLAPIKLSPQSQTALEGRTVGRYYIPVSRSPLTVAYNTDLGRPVESIDQLLHIVGDQPIGIIDAANSITQSYQYFRWQQLYGDDVLQRLASHQLSVYTSGASMSQSLASGEIAYGLGQPSGYIPVVKGQGAPVDEVIMSEGTVGAQYGPGILSYGPHPNAAQVFANWLVSPEGQQALLRAQGGALATEIPGSVPWNTVELAPWTVDDKEKWLREQWSPIVK